VKKALVAGLFVLVLFAPAVSMAAGVTGPLVPGNTAVSNGTTNSESKGTDYTLCDLVKLANNIINFAVAVSVFVATLVFAYGGILYVTGAAGGDAQIKKAHKVLLNAVLGILIILLSWLIVNVVVSVLTTQSVDFWTGWVKNCPSNSINTNITPSTNTPTTPAATAAAAQNSSLFPVATLTDDQARAQLAAAGIGVSSSHNCTDQNDRYCTSLEGIPSGTIQNLINLKQQCNCDVTVTGGTEVGHISHGSGKSIVDIRFDQTTANYIQANRSTLGITAICTTAADAQYRYNCNYPETEEHLHLQF
jgi:hypothetical protein